MEPAMRVSPAGPGAARTLRTSGEATLQVLAQVGGGPNYRTP